jgi:DNA-binding NtrC family response regulator
MWVAQDPRSLRVLEQAQQAATGTAPILIQGEAGTGKNLLATLIHELSNAAAPLIYFAPASLPPDLVETELFGAEDAGVVQRGRLELAHGGTLVLDELAALPRSAQDRLLHVIEEKSFRRPGGTRPVSANVRVVALTVVDLEHLLQSGTVRGDLLGHFRANVLSIPALRERSADIPALASRFLDSWSTLHRTTSKTLTASALDALRDYPFPANVTELKQLLERASAQCQGTEVGPADLPRHVTENAGREQGARSLEDVEREHIAKILEFTRGRKTEAADILGISRKTLLEKRKRYGLG